MEWLKAMLLGWAVTLGDVPLEHGGCYLTDQGAARECVFDASTCEAGCGAELTAFEAKIAEHNRSINYAQGWTLRIEGEVPIAWTEPWVSRSNFLDIDCSAGWLESMGAEVPTRGLPIIQPGEQSIRYPQADTRLSPGDILFDPMSNHQVPVASVHPDRIELAWPWTGLQARMLKISQGKLVSLEGRYTSFSRDVCDIHDGWTSRWKNGRQRPVTVVRTPGWDVEDGFCTSNFEHPGDYHHVNVSLSPAGATNGVRYTGCAVQSHGVVTEHGKLLQEGYPPEGIGAGFLLIANTVKVEPRRLMNSASRCFTVVGGHRIELEGICEGPLQMMWAPTGVSSLLFDGAMNHQNSSAPRDLPWIDLGTRTGNNKTSADIRFPFIFFQWGTGLERQTLIRAQGDPVSLRLNGNVKSLERVLDVPAGSVVTGHVACLDRPGYICD